MASNVASDYLSFADVAYCIRSYQPVKNGLDPNQKVVDHFLANFTSAIAFVTSFHEGELTNDSKTRPIELRGADDDNISEESSEQADSLAKMTGINRKILLRVITQAKSKIYVGVSMLQLAHYAFQERNAALFILSSLLNNKDFTHTEGNIVQEINDKRYDICKDMIQLARKIILKEFEESQINDKYMEGRKLAEIKQLTESQNLVYVTNILRTLTMLILNATLPNDVVDLWFRFVEDTNDSIREMLSVDSNIPEMIGTKIEALITVNTLLVLGLDSTTSSINFDAPYYSDADCFGKLNSIFKSESVHPAILYMWSFILFSKYYALEELPNKESQFIQSVFGKTPIFEVMASFASRAENANIFESIKKLSSALSSESLYSAIISSYVRLSLNFIPLNSQTSDMIKAVLLRAPDEFVEGFLSDTEFEKKLTILRAKLPLIDEALLPLVNLTAVHIQFANFEWRNLNTYAVKSKLAELDYDIYDETEATSRNLDLIVLKKEFLVKPPLEFDEEIFLPLPEDTKGKILPTAASSDEDVIVFMYNYSGWAVLGRILQNLCEFYIKNDLSLDNRTRHTMISIVELITRVVSPETPIERSTEIIEYLSASVTDDDIVSIILKIFEHSAHKRNYELTAVTTKFLGSLFPNFPHFVWSHIARSDLLDRYGKTGLATTILGSVELPNGIYDFTLSLLKLANEMVTESIALESGFPSRTKKDLLEKLTIHFIDVSESYQQWKYTKVIQRFELGFHLTSFFTKILYAVYGFDSQSAPNEKVTCTLAKCGSHIVNAFLGSQSPDTRPAISLLNILLSNENSQISLLSDEAFGYVSSKLVMHSFELTSLLLSIRGFLKMPPSSLEKMIYANSPKLVDLYHSTPTLKRHIIRLLHSLVKVPWSDNYLFLLSYLGEKHSEALLNTISSDLESPLTNHKLSKDLYMFFSALMESKQDGLSILFLTGSIASRKTEEKDTRIAGKTSVLSILKKNALNLDSLPEDVACCLLDSIAYAFNTWANAKDCKADAEFISVLLKRVREFKAPEASSIEEMEAASTQYRLISRIIEIFALYLFTSSEVDSQISQLLDENDLAFINQFFQITGYNSTLHEYLEKNFMENWPRLKLDRFAVTPLFSSGSFSRDAIFAIPLMDRFFGDDEKWTGVGRQRGYRDEIIEASSNLKYITHQIAAAKAWGALLTTFLKKREKPPRNSFLDLAIHFLQVNLDSGIEAPLFTEVYCERLQLVFYILYSFQKRAESLPEKTLFKLLELLTAVFKSDQLEFVANIGQSTKRNFYRPILRSILLALGFVRTGAQFIEMESDQLLELFELSFSKGVYLIMSEILSDISTSTSNGRQVAIFNMEERVQDLFLLLSLFAKFKALNPPDRFNLIMASSLNEVGTVKVILNLYSTSHLFKMNGETVFAPLTLTFISELCTIDHIATKFISNGLFTVLLESPLSVAIQEGKIIPEEQASLHNIWTNGLLSIILLLLSEFGGKVMPECCLFVSYFSQQIKNATCRWSDSKLAVSTALIRETSQLILLQKMMQALNYQQFLTNPSGRSLQNGNHKQVELIIGLDTEQERKLLKNVLNRLLTHPKYLNSRVVPTTIEEQRQLEADSTRIEFVKSICKHIKDLQESLT